MARLKCQDENGNFTEPAARQDIGGFTRYVNSSQSYILIIILKPLFYVSNTYE